MSHLMRMGKKIRQHFIDIELFTFILSPSILNVNVLNS